MPRVSALLYYITNIRFIIKQCGVEAHRREVPFDTAATRTSATCGAARGGGCARSAGRCTRRWRRRALLAQGRIQARVARQLPLERAAEGLRLAESGTVSGKVVLVPALA